MAMMSKSALGGVAMVGLLLTFDSRAVAQNGSQLRDWRASVLADAPQAKPRAVCVALIALTAYEFSVTTAASVPR